MRTFEETLDQFEPMISSIIRKLHIYRDFDHFRQTGRVALWQASERFDETKGNFAPFAYRTIYGALLDELKRESRFTTVHVPAEDDILELMGIASLEDEGDADLEECLSGLTLEERKLLSLLYVERLSQADCAVYFGISIPGIKKRRERLLLKLREQLTARKAQFH